MSAPLFVVPDTMYDPPRRYLVKNKGGDVLFITGLNEADPEEEAIKWAIREGGWLAGLIEGGKIPDNLSDRQVVLTFGYSKPLYVVLDIYGKRFLVVDEEENVLFLTDLDDHEPELTATLVAMQLGGWLKGAIKTGFD
ncbi:hypothetical protein E2P71_07965 [Candidatus Bathyarchaeota archaeon]|nr:hypothetical protein E2P71_07965 [Candidatus Bathyarchaeota archaeon]